MRATAEAHPNIAVVKYWGKRDVALNLPAVPSLSLTVAPFRTVTTVEWGIDAPVDEVFLDDRPATAAEARRVSDFLDLVAELAGEERPRCRVVSRNDFPTAAGLASSSSGFAALALAAAGAAGLDLSPVELSRLARRGSGSACRSIWGGWVEWLLGAARDGSDSHGRPLAPRDHWDLRVVVATVSGAAKPVGSREAMIRTAETSPYHPVFVATAPDDVARARRAVLDRDLAALGAIMEASTHKMHADMLAAVPPIRYWRPATLAVLDAVDALRREGVGAWATMDAGPNVKVLCEPPDTDAVVAALEPLVDAVGVLGVGDGARLLPDEGSAEELPPEERPTLG